MEDRERSLFSFAKGIGRFKRRSHDVNRTGRTEALSMSEFTIEQQSNGIPTPEELGFDPVSLRQKYAAERAKRLRPDGNDQYLEIAGALEHYNTDPYVE